MSEYKRSLPYVMVQCFVVLVVLFVCLCVRAFVRAYARACVCSHLWKCQLFPVCHCVLSSKLFLFVCLFCCRCCFDFNVSSYWIKVLALCGLGVYFLDATDIHTFTNWPILHHTPSNGISRWRLVVPAISDKMSSTKPEMYKRHFLFFSFWFLFFFGFV